jgi:hypothetical protein
LALRQVFSVRIPFLTRAVGSGLMRLTASGERTYEQEILGHHRRTAPVLYLRASGFAVGDVLGFVVGLGTDLGSQS